MLFMATVSPSTHRRFSEAAQHGVPSGQDVGMAGGHV